MELLPIDQVLDQLARELADDGAVVLRAPTGAGKTTRVPPRALAVLQTVAPQTDGQVVVVEPRRVAARAAASRVAQEQGWSLGQEVGYRVRFDDCSSKATRLLFVTEGVLLAQVQRDPFLEGVGAIVFDEFHERSLASDLGLSMVEQVRRTVREDLRLIVMSATLETEALAEFLGHCAVVESHGRLHPVEVEYLRRADDRPVVARAISAISRALDPSTKGSDDGDILVFLPGVGEIRRVKEAMSSQLETVGIEVHELYGDLPLDRQQAALRGSSDGRRRVVLATNVAETSVTVEGVTTVIDSGLERRLEVDSATGFDRLELRAISKGSARQRKGRAGRERPGRCLRLWTASEQSQRLESIAPEVRRLDLAGPLLTLVVWGEAEPLAFPWFEAPDARRGELGLELLQNLGAIHRDGERCQATEDGKMMATLGCHPRLARLLLDLAAAGALERGARLAALLEERDVFRRPEPGWQAAKCRSDVLERLRAVEAFDQGKHSSRRLIPQRARRVLRSARQLAKNARSAGVVSAPPTKQDSKDSDDLLLRSLLRAFPDRLARRRDSRGSSRSRQTQRAVLVGGRGVRVARSSGVHEAALFLALDVGRASALVDESARASRKPSASHGATREALVFQASEVLEEWLDPALIQTERMVAWDETSGRARATQTRSFVDLVLDRKEVAAESHEAEAALCQAATLEPERFLALDDPEVEQLLARVATLAAWHPELGLPELSPRSVTDLLPAICTGCRSSSDLAKVRLTPYFRALLDRRQQQALDRHVPTELELQNGRRARLRYHRSGEPPVLAIRIQLLFGVRETPTVDLGRRPVLLHLLAPNQRPQQVTTDLAGFWQGSYSLVKKALAGRYPKHSWPDEPATASPPPLRRRPRRR